MTRRSSPRSKTRSTSSTSRPSRADAAARALRLPRDRHGRRRRPCAPTATRSRRYQLRVAAARQRRNAGHVGRRSSASPYDSPIVLAPVSSQRAFHPEGELAVAQRRQRRKHLQILSTVVDGVEAVNAARGEPVWFQLYPTNDWNVTQALVARADKAGCPVLVLTVDNLGNNRARRRARLTRPTRVTCTVLPREPPRPRASSSRRPMFSGLDLSRPSAAAPQDWTGTSSTGCAT